MTTHRLGGLVFASSIVGFSMQGWAQEPDIGKTEYQLSCASCHGLDGKGTGPVADALKPRPADLTIMAKKNNGVFPFGRIYEVIDGRQEVKSHGPREMPVWGHRLAPPPASGAHPVVPYYIDPVYDREPVIRARILAVIEYLYRMQEK